MSEKDIEYWKQQPIEEILQQWHDCIKNGEVLLDRIDKAIEYIEADYINGAVDGLSWLEVQKLLKILKGEDNE